MKLSYNVPSSAVTLQAINNKNVERFPWEGIQDFPCKIPFYHVYRVLIRNKTLCTMYVSCLI